MLFLNIWICFSSFLNGVNTYTCGIDNSPFEEVTEGITTIETYPWLGVLYYPHGLQKYTVAVVLITRQIVLAAANEIDQLPKDDFRKRVRVVIGHNCSGPSFRIRDYAFHPDFSRGTFSTLAMIQLDTDHSKLVFRPICPPPTYFRDLQDFFAMVLSNNCKRSEMRIHKMNLVNSTECKTFYRRTGLDVATMWPLHTACATSTVGGHCIWRSGAILTVKVGTRWRLLGFGVYGPGCQSPARFLDYGMYHNWVQRSVERVGRPTITTVADNHVVLRRSQSNIQRFGVCDLEEMAELIYYDEMHIAKKSPAKPIVLTREVLLVTDVEYSCIIFKADYGANKGKYDTPKLNLRRWCAGGSGGMCYGFGFLEINFYVEITFKYPINVTIAAYGRIAKHLHYERVLTYLNFDVRKPPILNYRETLSVFHKNKGTWKENKSWAQKF